MSMIYIFCNSIAIDASSPVRAEIDVNTSDPIRCRTSERFNRDSLLSVPTASNACIKAVALGESLCLHTYCAASFATVEILSAFGASILASNTAVLRTNAVYAFWMPLTSLSLHRDTKRTRWSRFSSTIGVVFVWNIFTRTLSAAILPALFSGSLKIFSMMAPHDPLSGCTLMLCRYAIIMTLPLSFERSALKISRSGKTVSLGQHRILSMTPGMGPCVAVSKRASIDGHSSS
mmetsp:Transcript_13822/g.27544  ORF Transcript_13822/g.27544 Transcript_13822/m.27544 type:complete len:233 (+) Transcript_13822:554-1252(+)